MNSRKARTRQDAAPTSSLFRQLIVCAVALCIMSAGIWSLMNDSAPYHPQDYSDAAVLQPDEVSRDGTFLLSVSDGN